MEFWVTERMLQEDVWGKFADIVENRSSGAGYSKKRNEIWSIVLGSLQLIESETKFDRGEKGHKTPSTHNSSVRGSNRESFAQRLIGSNRESFAQRLNKTSQVSIKRKDIRCTSMKAMIS
ncbi:hypothetical protein MAR_002706 [Mya arenaria]|uniref:MADF domain-containing protein n=1 Tax=Mya arenaria TaxID=6604 RepID=A0ABY7G7F9_MYAAR|nr:hypothetical protein MAR_002706 [Mya arenaria]